MLSVRMRFILLTICMYGVEINAASIKKSISESALKNEITTEASKQFTVPNKTADPAIIAIEIVDAPETNSTSKSNSKRTIESSLGYGYHGPRETNLQKKFVIYKYSQNDIPSNSYTHNNNEYSATKNIQKSVGYHLGTQVEQVPSAEQKIMYPIYQAPVQQTVTQYQHPGPVLYTTFNGHGQVGDISTQIPYHTASPSRVVPVIILRVYSNQLNSPHTALHTNLPQAHPYSTLNNINLQSLLQTYLEQYLHSQQPVQHYQPTYQQAYQQYQQPEEYPENLPTSENYPSDQHTQVIFPSNNGHISQAQSMLRTAGLSHYKSSEEYQNYQVAQPSYTNVNVQVPHPHYVYSQDAQDDRQAYTYEYPNQIAQEVYYQQNNQNYQTPHSAQVTPNSVHNSHESSHIYRTTTKERRSKNNKSSIASTTSPKRREPRDKLT